MKIALAVHHFPPTYNAGAEKYALQLAKEMVKRGHKVFVFCVEKIDIGRDEQPRYEDRELEGIPVRRLFFDLYSSPHKDLWEFDNGWIGEQVKTWFRDISPDIFHLVSGYLLTGSVLRSAQELGLPIVVTLTDFWFLCPRITMLDSRGNLSYPPVDIQVCAKCRGEEKKLFRAAGDLFPKAMKHYWEKSRLLNILAIRKQFLEKCLNFADAIITPSRFLGKIYSEAGFNAELIEFIRHGRDFPSSVSRDISQVKSQTLRVGYLGQIAWHKGVHIIFEAMRILDQEDIQLSIYGNPNQFPEYYQTLTKLKALDDRIKFRGRYNSDSELSEIFRGLDVIIVPSLWYENCPMVILEAFANKTPVIATNLGGMAELVQNDKNGILFARGSAIELAQALKRLKDDQDLLDRLRNGIEKVRSVQQETDDLESVYLRVRRRS